MKKILAMILSCVLCLVAIPTVAFADEPIVDNSPLGVITDAEGNIVETLVIPRSVPSNGKYVDSICTIPAKGTLTSYQYEPKRYIEFGFAYYADDEQTVVTTRNGMINLQLFKSASIGGTRELDYQYRFSTNYEDVFIDSPEDINGYHGWAFVNQDLEYYPDPSKPYYNGKYVNESNFPITLRVLVWMDP